MHYVLVIFMFVTIGVATSGHAADKDRYKQSSTQRGENEMSMQLETDIRQIEYLQRLYAKATDAVGRADDQSVAIGREIYHQIFTPDVQIRTSNTGAEPLTAQSPDEWVDVVYDALKDYTGTQHLIGTQLVTLDGDRGEMESYVHAWHKNPDGTVYHFLGTYLSKVKRVGAGWQIHDMNLRHDTSGTMATE